MIYICQLESCGKEFQGRRTIARRYCSNKCHAVARSTNPQKVGIRSRCQICNKEFYSRPHREFSGRGKYCSKECRTSKGRLYADREWLTRVYCQERWTMEAIATAADSNPETIRRWTKTFNLKRKKIFSETHKARISKVWLGRKHKPESKEKIKQAQLGEKGHNWKGGHRTNARIQAPWKANRKAALKRDNYICQRCSRQRSDDGKSLDVHHKIPFRCFEVAAIAHELHNLQTLCRQCHFIVEAAMQVMDAQFGSGCTVWHFVNIYGARFGDNVSVGSYAEIGKNVTVGNDVAIGSQSFIPEGFKIGNNVFIGPRFCGTNDKYPPTPKDIWVPAQTVIEDDVSIGAAVVLLPGIVVGKGARIAAGSIVTRNVPPNTLVRGEPARERAYQSLMPLRLLRREMEPYV